MSQRGAGRAELHRIRAEKIKERYDKRVGKKMRVIAEV